MRYDADAANTWPLSDCLLRWSTAQQQVKFCSRQNIAAAQHWQRAEVKTVSACRSLTLRILASALPDGHGLELPFLKSSSGAL